MYVLIVPTMRGRSGFDSPSESFLLSSCHPKLLFGTSHLFCLFSSCFFGGACGDDQKCGPVGEISARRGRNSGVLGVLFSRQEEEGKRGN